MSLFLFIYCICVLGPGKKNVSLSTKAYDF